MDIEKSRINLVDLFYKEEEITSLNAPRQVLVSQGMYSGEIKIHWDEVPYAKSYRIERAIIEMDSSTGTYQEPDEGDFSVLSKYVYSNNYVDVILTTPGYSNKEYSNRYYYRVSAENIPKGLESSEFTETTVASCGWLLAPPSAIDAGKGDDSEFIQVKWNAVPYANKYLIYRGEKENGLGMEYLDSVTGNQLSYKNILYSSEKGNEYYYKVCAELSDGSRSAFTGLALGYSIREGAPSAPGNINVTNGNGVSTTSLSITWDQITYDPSYDVKYAVYRTSSIDSIYSLVSTNLTSASVTDISVKPGIKYYYYVQTVVNKKDDPTEILKSSFSKTGPESDSPVEGWLLSAPSNSEVTDSSDTSKYEVRWTPAVGYEDVEYKYNIYYLETIDGENQLLERNVLPELGEDGYYSFIVNKKPFYKISTVNPDAGYLESDFGTIIAPCPSAPEKVVATKTSSLGDISKYTPNTNGVYPVKITWNPPADENPYGYYVYRSTKPDSSFRKITDNPITDGVFEFIDENETARAGTFYYYKVVSLNVLMQGKKSNEQNANSRGYGALTREQWFREYNKTIMSSQAKLTLMHKSGDTDKLGSEKTSGNISGTLSYDASVQGLGGRVIMHYENYCDSWANNSSEFGKYFVLTGNTNTSASMSKNGTMDGTTNASTEGMYPGYAVYDNIQIKGGAAAGGTYNVCTKDKNGNVILPGSEISWTVGEN